MKLVSTVLFAVSFVVPQSLALAATAEHSPKLDTPTGQLAGTLLIAENNNGKHSEHIALIIAGSGPTDRNGNNPMMRNNSLKMLAESLAGEGISSLRYDKRGIGESAGAAIAESDLRFEDYINDAKLWVDFLSTEHPNKRITIAGHSEGALIGAVVAQASSVDKFVSLAGAGRSIDKVLREQLNAQPAIVSQSAIPIIDSLLAGKTVGDVPTFLTALFRKSVQPYLISWFAYSPQKVIAKLHKPVLIVQGTTDIQITQQDAKMLAAANPKAKLVMIDNMNHIFKQAPSERTANIATYSQPDLPIAPGLIEVVANFIKQN